MNAIRTRRTRVALVSILLILTGLNTPAEAHFAASHTHHGTVLHQVFEQLGFRATIVQGKNNYIQNNTTVKNATYVDQYCATNNVPRWTILSCTHTLENQTSHVGMFTYGDFTHTSGVRYKQRAHFHAFGSGGWAVWCDIVTGSLPPNWFDTCSGSRS